MVVVVVVVVVVRKADDAKCVRVQRGGSVRMAGVAVRGCMARERREGVRVRCSKMGVY